MRLALVRHAPPLIAPGSCYGRLDVPARPDGGRILAEIVRRLSGGGPWFRVWTSPSRRCADLARDVALILPCPMRIDDRLRELDFGAWEGRAWAEIDRRLLDRWAADPLGFAAPDGESGAALIARVASFAASLTQRNEDAVIVSHGGPLRILPALLAGTAPDLLAAPPALGSVALIETPA